MATFENTVPKVALVTNIPAPYRVPFWNMLGNDGRIDLTIIFCAGKEPNRQWDLEEFRFKFVFLKEAFVTQRGRYIHNNYDVMRQLRAINPDVVITTGFSPTFLYAFFFAWWNRRRHVCMTDGTLDSETKLSIVHKLIRAVVFRKSRAFIGASDGSLALYRYWDIPDDRIFKSPLCIDNERFGAVANFTKSIDLIFCGRFAEEKQPLFVFDVADRLSTLLGRTISVLFVGSGDLEPAMRERAQQTSSVHSTFHGFATQAELPELYGQARVFVFPTLGDVWGIVVSEACAAGLPVISTPFAGVVGEIVQDGTNGFVIDLDPDAWAQKLQRLLTDETLYKRFSHASRGLVVGHDYVAATGGAMNAIIRAVNDPS